MVGNLHDVQEAGCRNVSRAARARGSRQLGGQRSLGPGRSGHSGAPAAADPSSRAAALLQGTKCFPAETLSVQKWYSLDKPICC